MNNSIPRLASTSQFTIYKMSNITGTNQEIIKKIVEDLKLQPQNHLSREAHKPVDVYDLQQFTLVIEEINKTETASETDEAVVDLESECGHSFVQNFIRGNDITKQRKHRNPIHGLRGIANHVSQQDAERIRIARDMLEQPIYGLTRLQDIARKARVGESALNGSLTPEEREHIQKRRVRGLREHNVSFLPDEVAEQVRKRLQRYPLEPTKITLAIARAHVGGFSSSLIKYLEKKEYPVEKIKIVGQGQPASCYGWDALRALEEQYGRREGTKPIDYDRLTGDNPDLGYAQEVQKRYVHESSLAKLDLGKKPAAQPKLVPTLQSPPPTPQGTSEQSKDWQDLGAFLSEANCTPLALKKIMSSLRINPKLIRRIDDRVEVHQSVVEPVIERCDKLRKYRPDPQWITGYQAYELSVIFQVPLDQLLLTLETRVGAAFSLIGEHPGKVPPKIDVYYPKRDIKRYIEEHNPHAFGN